MAKRRSHAQRTGSDTRAAAILAKAFAEKPVFVETAEGYLIRQWNPEDGIWNTNEECAATLRGKRAFELEELHETLKPAPSKYCVSHKWLVKAPAGGFYLVTERAAKELKLPTKGMNGLKIKFAPVPQ